MMTSCSLKVDNTPLKSLQRSLKLEIRLHATRLARLHDLVPKPFLRSCDWLMRSELGYCARSLICRLKRRFSKCTTVVHAVSRMVQPWLLCGGFVNYAWSCWIGNVAHGLQPRNYRDFSQFRASNQRSINDDSKVASHFEGLYQNILLRKGKLSLIWHRP